MRHLSGSKLFATHPAIVDQSTGSEICLLIFLYQCGNGLKNPNTVFDLISAHAPLSAQSSNLEVFSVLLSPLKNICCWYSFELPRLVEAIQMSTNNICCYKDSQKNISITKTYLYNFDPLKPHFYIVKLGFTGVYIIFIISAQNIDCGYSLEPPRRGGSNEYPQSMFKAEIWKISKFFILIFQFFFRWNFVYIWIGMFS